MVVLPVSIMKQPIWLHGILVFRCSGSLHLMFLSFFLLSLQRESMYLGGISDHLEMFRTTLRTARKTDNNHDDQTLGKVLRKDPESSWTCSSDVFPTVSVV